MIWGVNVGGTGASTAAGARINLGLGPDSSPTFTNLTLTGNLTVAGTATFGSASFTSLTVPDNTFSITGSSDATKILRFEVDGFTTATTRTITIPNASTTMVGTDTVQTLTNKTIGVSQLSGQVAVANGGTGVATITGLVSGNGTSAFVGRTITGTANEITVTDGSGATANPTLSLPAALTFTGKTVTGGTFNSTFNGTIGATTPNTGAFTTVTLTANSAPLLTLTRSSSAINSVIAYTNASGTVYAGHGAANTFAIDDDADISNAPWFSITSTTATFSTALTTTGAFTSIGIDDNATGERLQLADTFLTLGTTGEIYNIVKPADDAGLVISGGTAFNTGAAIILRGGSTGISQDNHIVMLSAGTTVYRYDPSITEHTFTGELTIAATTTGRLSLGNGGAFLQYTGATNTFDLNNTSGSVLLIDSGGKVTIPGGQIAFPATQVPSADANTLDDYEEGTFTPRIDGSTTAGTGTYSTQVGLYTKIGRVVYFNLTLVWSAHTGTGNIVVENLPFTVGATDSYSCAITYSGLTYPSPPLATALASTTSILIRTAASGGAITGLAMDTSATLRVSGFYFV